MIEAKTKLGWHVWDGLEIESVISNATRGKLADFEREAVFFLLTNVLIVFGLIAFDHSMAVLQAFPSVYPEVQQIPSPIQLMQAILLPIQKYDTVRIQGMREALARLRRKSRSFYLASSVFQGRLRIDLILL